MADPHDLEELSSFLSMSARPDLKARALQYVLGITSSSDGLQLLLSHAKLPEAFVALTQDATDRISTDAFKCIVNLTAKIVDSGEGTNIFASDKKLLAMLLKTVVDKTNINSDNACKVLTNLTRAPAGCRQVMDILQEDDFPVNLVMLVEAFGTKDYNKNANLNFIGTVLSNLTQLPEGREFVLDKDRCVVQRLLPYIHFKGSVVRRRGIVAALRNCCFETDYHEWLLSEAVDILPHLLLPLAGPEELTEKEMQGMPEDLQYLDEDKTREMNRDIKNMLIEAVMKLCVTQAGRKVVQDKRTYIIMREYHQWEKEPSLMQPCEDLIQILIGDEPEPGMENLEEVVIPDKIVKSLESSQ